MKEGKTNRTSADNASELSYFFAQRGLCDGDPSFYVENVKEYVENLERRDRNRSFDIVQAMTEEDRLKNLLRENGGSSACSCFHRDHTDFEGANDGCGHHPTVEFAYDENVREVVGFCRRCTNDHSPVAALGAPSTPTDHKA